MVLVYLGKRLYDDSEVISMQNMKYYYDFSGQKFGYPLSLSINSFQRQVFSAQKSLEISYVLKGEYEVITEHFTSQIHEHEFVIIAPLDIHILNQSNQTENIILTIHIDFERFPESMVGNPAHLFESMVCSSERNYKLYLKIKSKLGQLVSIFMKGEPNLFKLNVVMLELMELASNHQQYPIERLPLQSTHHENYMKAIQFIDQNYQAELRLEGVAERLSFSISYTSKLFKKYTGIPLVKYLAYVRIRASIDSLLAGIDSIEQISSDCGMPNSKAYATVFKELYGLVPSEYRKQFIHNLKFNMEDKQQMMILDNQQRELLLHLMSDVENTLYENEGVKIMNQNGHLHCQIANHPTTQFIISHTSEVSIIDIYKTK